MQIFLDRLISVLNATGLYSINESSAIYAELAAYAQAFQCVENQLNLLLPSIFIQENNEDCVEHWRKIFNITYPPFITSAEDCCNFILFRYALQDGTWSDESCTYFAYNYYFALEDYTNDTENAQFGIVFTDAVDIFDFEVAAHYLEEMMPPFTRFYADIDAPTFAQLDNYDYTVKEFEAYRLPWQILKDD